MDSPLIAAAARVGATLPRNSVLLLVGYLLDSPDGSLAGAQSLQPAPAFKSACADLWHVWKMEEGLSARTVAAAVDAASLATQKERERQRIELAVTGPSTYVVPVRKTEDVLLDLVAAAKHHLTLISFAAYKVDSLVEAIATAVSRGVKARILLEDSASGNLDASPVETFASLSGYVSMLTWDLDKRPLHGSHYAAMHAKAAVADSRVAFVTSANFTGKALEQNLELGVLIRGGRVPAQIDKHLDTLIAYGIVHEE